MNQNEMSDSTTTFSRHDLEIGWLIVILHRMTDWVAVIRVIEEETDAIIRNIRRLQIHYEGENYPQQDDRIDEINRTINGAIDNIWVSTGLLRRMASSLALAEAALRNDLSPSPAGSTSE